MRTQRVFSGARPTRIAFMVDSCDKDWRQNCFSVLDNMSQIWGGYANVIIPSDGEHIHDVFWQLLDAFDPDVLVPYWKTWHDIEIFDNQRFEDELHKQCERWGSQTSTPVTEANKREIANGMRRQRMGAFNISPELLEQIKLRLSPFYFENAPTAAGAAYAGEGLGYPHTDILKLLPALKTPPSEFEFSKPQDYESASLFAATQEGFCFDRTIASINTELPALTIVETPPVPVGSRLRRMFRQEKLPLSIAELSLSGLDTYHQSGFWDFELPTLLIAGDSLNDFCFYQAASRMRNRVVWIPFLNDDLASPETRRLSPQETAFLYHLKSRTKYQSNSSTDLAFVSMTLGKDRLEQLIAPLRVEPYFAGQSIHVLFPSECVPTKPLRVFERNNQSNLLMEQINDEDTLEHFEPQLLRNVKDFSPQDIRWVSDLSFPGLSIPKHYTMAQWMMGSNQNTTREIRTTNTGVAFQSISSFLAGGWDTQMALTRPSIRIPAARKALSAIASKAGLRAETSDKGFYTSVALEKLGGLEQAAQFLRSRTGISFMEAYLAKDGPSLPGIYLRDDHRRYLDVRAVQSVAEDPEDAKSLLDKFSKQAILYRGFIFLCEFCRRSAWFPVAEITDSFTCKRCHRTQIYTSRHWKKPDQPNWYHQLDEVIYQSFNHDGNIPVLALDVLRRRAKQGFSFSEELQYVSTKIGGENRIFECDINCVVDGKITIGEAKKSDRLAASAGKEASIIEGYRQLAEALNVKQIVFATAAESWRADTLRMIKAKIPSRFNVELLTESDLYEHIAS